MKTKFLGVSLEKLILSANETIYMLSLALIIGSIIGLIMAISLVITKKGGIKENKYIYFLLSTFINMIRSIPFIILLVSIMPLTRLIAGTTIGTTAALVPLVFYISPYMARLIENSLLEVSNGIIEAAKAMGATDLQIILHFILPETMASMVLSITTGAIGLLGATAMAGYVGGGGIGNLALTYGYERFNTALMLFTVGVLIVFVQVLQVLGNIISEKLRNK